jgi:hypothetical protein
MTLAPWAARLLLLPPLWLSPSSKRMWEAVEGPGTLVVGAVSFAWAMACLMKRVAAALSTASWPVRSIV